MRSQPTGVDTRSRGSIPTVIYAGLVVVLAHSSTPPLVNADPKDDAQSHLTTRVFDAAHHDVGELELRTSNAGHFGSALGDDVDAVWRGGEYLNVAAIWIGAEKLGAVSVSTGAYELEFLPPLDPEWRIYTSHEGFPGGDRLGIAPNPDDDGDRSVDEDVQNGLDDDGDGRFDEDFAAVSDQMFSAQYWDISSQSQNSYPDHRPLDVLVRERSYAWSASGLDDVVVFEYTVHNIGSTTLNDVFLGLYVDPDLGPPDSPGFWQDDGAGFASFDTTVVDTSLAACRLSNVSIRMAYAFDFPDAGPGSAGDVPGFAGLLFLDHSVDRLGVTAPQTAHVRTCRILSDRLADPNNDPINDQERYELMSSEGVPVHATVTPDDYRFYLGVGPFASLPPDTSLTMTLAFIVGEGYVDPVSGSPRPDRGPDGLWSEQSLIAVATRTQLAYQGIWMDTDGDPETGANGSETCIAPPGGGSVLWDDPCDLDPPVELTGTCADPVMWVDEDCDPCTPNPFQPTCNAGGCETRVRWFPSQIATPVHLASFDAHRLGSSVLVRWAVSSMSNHAGFHVYREAPGLGRERLTTAPLADRRTYEFEDRSAPPGNVDYWLVEIAASRAETWYGPVSIPAVNVGYPLGLELSSRPNPFNTATVIQYELGEAAPVRLAIYDVEGRLVARLVDGEIQSGRQAIRWSGVDRSGTRVAPGRYFARLETRDIVRTWKLARTR